jgi:hypothetical protein
MRLDPIPGVAVAVAVGMEVSDGSEVGVGGIRVPVGSGVSLARGCGEAVEARIVGEEGLP